jgi:hypothetical protein
MAIIVSEGEKRRRADMKLSSARIRQPRPGGRRNTRKPGVPGGMPPDFFARFQTSPARRGPGRASGAPVEFAFF